jgi:hypothetical protein
MRHRNRSDPAHSSIIVTLTAIGLAVGAGTASALTIAADITVQSTGVISITADIPDLSFTGQVAVSSFELTAPFFQSFPAGPEIVNLAVSISDFAAPSEYPRAQFFDGAFAGLDIVNALGSVVSGGQIYDLIFNFDFDSTPGNIITDNAGEANLMAQRQSDTILFDNLSQYDFVVTDDGMQGVVPEPSAGLLFAVGCLVSCAARRRPAGSARSG